MTHLAGIREHFLDRLTDKERRLQADIWERMLASPDTDKRKAATKRRRS